jgi:hypothetical protein
LGYENTWQISFTSASEAIAEKQVFSSTGKRGIFLNDWRDACF